MFLVCWTGLFWMNSGVSCRKLGNLGSMRNKNGVSLGGFAQMNATGDGFSTSQSGLIGNAKTCKGFG